MGIIKNGQKITGIRFGDQKISTLFKGNTLLWQKPSDGPEYRLVFFDNFNRANTSITAGSNAVTGKYYGSSNSRIVNKAYNPVYATRGFLNVKVKVPYVISVDTDNKNKKVGIYNITSSHYTQDITTNYSPMLFTVRGTTAYIDRAGYDYNFLSYPIPLADRKKIYRLHIKVEKNRSYFYLDEKLIYSRKHDVVGSTNRNAGIYHDYCYGEGWLDNLMIHEYDL